MNPRDRLLERAAAGENIREEAARLVAQKKQAKRSRSVRLAPRKAPGREAKQALREERNERTAAIRRVVWVRANRFGTIAAPCECGCGLLITKETFHMDHWIGGSSRQSMNTVENCWALTPDCDEDKTNMGGKGRQTVETWNEKRRLFCNRHDLPFTPRKPTRYAAPPQTSPAREDDR